jgi:hypothetical protein
MTKLLIISILVITTFVGGYVSGRDGAVENCEADMGLIKADLLAANDIPRPIKIHKLGLEIVGWEKGFVINAEERDR